LLPHATQLLSTVEQVLAQRLGVLWIDCQHIEEVGRIGQQAILQVERLAAAAQVLVYWCGFSKPVMEQMSESGLHLLLRNLPVVSYYDSGE
jgi:anti-anti-sigma regulatory factor